MSSVSAAVEKPRVHGGNFDRSHGRISFSHQDSIRCYPAEPHAATCCFGIYRILKPMIRSGPHPQHSCNPPDLSRQPDACILRPSCAPHRTPKNSDQWRRSRDKIPVNARHPRRVSIFFLATSASSQQKLNHDAKKHHPLHDIKWVASSATLTPHLISAELVRLGFTLRLFIKVRATVLLLTKTSSTKSKSQFTSILLQRD